MAFDAFINIDDIEGESTDDQHTGWIEVLDCSVGIRARAKIIPHFMHPCFRPSWLARRIQNPRNSSLFLRF